MNCAIVLAGRLMLSICHYNNHIHRAVVRRGCEVETVPSRGDVLLDEADVFRQCQVSQSELHRSATMTYATTTS